MTPKRIRPEDLTGSGDLTPIGPGPSGGGWQILDARPRGFLARITGQVASNEYTYTRCDDGDHTFPAIPTDLNDLLDGNSAYETSLSTSVPTDGSAVVWLEPLRGAAGYGFRYGAAASGSIDAVGDIITYPIASSGAWLNLFINTLPIPAVGKCLVVGTVNFLVNASAIAGDSSIRSRAWNATAGGVVANSMSVTTILNAGVDISITHKFVAYQNITVPSTIRLEVYRGSGATWTTSNAQALDAGPGDATTYSLAYIAP